MPETETALRLVNLGGRDADVHHDPINRPVDTTGEQIAHITESTLYARKSRVSDASHCRTSLRIAIEREQPGALSDTGEQLLAVTAAPEGAIDIDTIAPEGEVFNCF